MLVFDNMPNYNHRNPFVIMCSEARAKADQLKLTLTKQVIHLMLGLVAVASLQIMLYFSLSNETMPAYIYFAVLMSVAIAIPCLIQFVLIREGIYGNPILTEVDARLNMDMSEIARINNEEMLDTLLLLSKFNTKVACTTITCKVLLYSVFAWGIIMNLGALILL